MLIYPTGANINNLRYADDTTLKAESKEELKSPLMKVKEESEKAGLKLNIQEVCSVAPRICLLLASTVLGRNRPMDVPCSSL